VPTATPLAGPWRLHRRLASAQDGWLTGSTFLADGRVLVLWNEELPGIEGQSRSGLYDPLTDTWTQLSPPWDYQEQPPGFVSMVGLADGGALAVFGSASDDGGLRTQSALFDPVEGAWLPPADMPVTAEPGVLLGDGRVLMFWNERTYLFDPATGSLDPGPTLPFDKAVQSAVVLDDESVLALADGQSARLPAGGVTWLRSGRAAVSGGAYLTAIPGGAVALGGTRPCDGPCFPPDPRTAVYRADADRWSPGPDAPPIWDAGVAGPGSNSVSVVLADGRLLVAGGWGPMSDFDCRNGAAILSVEAGAWQSIEPMPACLVSGIGRLRADGTALIVGLGYVEHDDCCTPIGIEVLSYVP
jgi:hypothetical protein